MPRVSRRRFLQYTAMAAAASILGCTGYAEQPVLPHYDFESLPGLGVTARRAGMDYGAAIRYPQLSEEAYASAFAKECSVIVPEHALKWEGLRPAAGVWNFQPADALCEFAQMHHMKMRGHTLVWYFAFPKWAQQALDKDSGARMLEEHITTVVGRYRGRVSSWDVVNEAIHPEDNQADGMRDSLWLRALGPSYVERAFSLAHAADPSAELVYNDYGAEFSGKRADAILGLLRRLKDKGAPIHGVGIQAHLWATHAIDVKKLQMFCKEVKQMGLKLLITELDVKDSDLPDDIALRDRLGAARVRQFLETILAEIKPQQILTWGLTNKYSWLAMHDQNASERPVCSLPLDQTYQRTPVWKAIHDCLIKLQSGLN